MNSPEDQQRHHLADAKGCLSGIGGFYDGDQGRDDRDVRALASIAASQIAIAEQLERLNNQLASVIGKSAKEPFGSKRYHVRTGK